MSAVRDITVAPAGEESYHVASPHLGASKISTYLKCPNMYRLQYVEKIRVPSSPAAALGTVIHSVVRQAHAARWDSSNAHDAANSLQALWAEARETTSDPADPEANANAVKAATEWLPWYLHWRRAQIDVCVEEHWVLELSEGLMLEGTIDRVYRAAGETVISDVKSGARKPTPMDLHNDLQLSIYSWAARQMGVQEDALELVWLRQQETLRTARTDAYLDAVMTMTVQPVAQAIAAGIFPANPSSKFGCGFCNHRQFCEVGNGCN